jgi:DNA repair exonuclease SbcCD ATPase subunit
MNLKNLLVAAAVVVFSTPSVSTAQMTAKGGAILASVREGERVMSQGSKNSLTVDLPKTSLKDAEKLWKDYAKQFKGETKKDKKTDEWLTDNAMIAAIGGANTIDMYTKFTESGETTTLGLWIDLGGAYVDSKGFADKYAEAEKILQNFALSVQREQTKKQLSDQQDDLKKMEKGQKKLEEKNADLVKDIENWKKKITQAEADIQTNLKQQEEQKAKVEAQKKLVEEINKKLATFN